MTWSLAAPQGFAGIPFNQTYGGHAAPYTDSTQQIWQAMQNAGIGMPQSQFMANNPYLGNMAPRYAFGNALKDSNPNQGSMWQSIGPQPSGVRVSGSSPGGFPAEYNTGDPYGNHQWMNNMGMNSGTANGQMGNMPQIQNAGNMQTQQYQPQSMQSAAPQSGGSPYVSPTGMGPQAIGQGINPGGNVPQPGGTATGNQAALFNLQGLAGNSGQNYGAITQGLQGANAGAINNSQDPNLQIIGRALMSGMSPQQIQQGWQAAGNYAPVDPNQIAQMQQAMQSAGIQPGTAAPSGVHMGFMGNGRRRAGLLGGGSL